MIPERRMEEEGVSYVLAGVYYTQNKSSAADWTNTL